MIPNHCPSLATTASGYTSVQPYYPNSETELLQYIAEHTCPCCASNTRFPSEEWTKHIYGNHEQFFAHMSDLCECGFKVPFFAGLKHMFLTAENDVVTQNESAQWVEQYIFEARCAIHMEKYDLALQWLQQAMAIGPYIPELFFLEGYCLNQTNKPALALSSYKIALNFDPKLKEAWFNRALIYQHHEDFPRASVNRDRYQRLANTTSLTRRTPRSDSKVLSEARGPSGNIKVIENQLSRFLTINERYQDGVWLQQGTASDFPLEQSSLATLLLGSHFNSQKKQTTGLIVGMGAGSSIISLLENFPKLHLTVLESDFNIITLVLRHFPKLKHFYQCHQLRILCQNEIEFLKQSAHYFDFSLINPVINAQQSQIKTLLTRYHLTRRICQVTGLFLEQNSALHERDLNQYLSFSGLNYGYGSMAEGSQGQYRRVLLLNEKLSGQESFIPYSNRSGCVESAIQKDFKNIQYRYHHWEHQHPIPISKLDS